MDAFVFYAYWNGAQVRDLFEALALMTTSAAFHQVAALLLILGMIVVIAMGAVKNEGRHIITYFACAVLFWFAAAVPKVTVAIHDIRTQSVYTVDNVPLGVGVFGSIANRLGYWLTTTYESAFAPVDVARFSKFGAVFPERVVEVLQSIGPVTFEARRDLEAVSTGCIAPELLTDEAKALELANTNDIWGKVNSAGWVNPARVVALPSGSVLACDKALEHVQTLMNTVELPALKRLLGAKLAPEHADPTAVIAAAIPQAEGLLLNLSRTMDQSLRHSLMLTVVGDTVDAHMARMADPMALSVQLAKSQGNLASEINYRTMTKIAQDVLPKIRNALEFVIIAMFPLMVLIALASGSAMGTIVRSYLTLLVTVQVWPALSSVVNYLMITYDAYPFGAIAREFSGNSLAAVALIRETGATSQAVAGALMCAVPVIAYALVRAGDVAVGQLVGGLTAPAQSAASAQGTALAAGNIQQGNVALGNYSANTLSANKMDASIGVSESGMLRSQSALGSVTRNTEGMVTGIQRTDVDLGVGAESTQGYVRGHATSNISQQTFSTNDAARFSFTRALHGSDATQKTFAYAFKDALAQEQGFGTARSHSLSAGSGSSVVLTDDVGMTNTVTEGTNVSSRASLGMDPSLLVHSGRRGMAANSFNVPTQTKTQSDVAGLGETARSATVGAVQNSQIESGHAVLQAAVNFNDAQNLLEQASGRSATASSRQSAEVFNTVNNALERVAQSHSDESVRSTARNMQESLVNGRMFARDSQVSLGESLTGASTLTEARQGAMHTKVDHGIPMMQAAIRRYGSAEKALQALFEKSQATGLATDAHWESMAASQTQTGFGTSSVVSAKEANQEAFEGFSTAFAKESAAMDAKVPEKTFETPTMETPSIDETYARRSFELESGRERSRANLDLERGILLLSREAYRLDNEDKNYAIRNAYFGALGYRSTDEIQDKLRDQAYENPDVAQVVRDIGSRNRANVSDQDWKKLDEVTKKGE